MFKVFSESIIDQIKFFIETNNKQMKMRESVIASIRELTNEKEIAEDLLIDHVSDRLDDPYIGKPLEELIRVNNAILEKDCINEYEYEFLTKIRNLMSNAYYFYPHLHIDMNAMFESDSIGFEEAFKAMDEMVEKLKEEECCPAREDNTLLEEEATVDTSDEIVEEVTEPIEKETIEETTAEEEPDLDNGIEETVEETVEAEPVEDSTEEVSEELVAANEEEVEEEASVEEPEVIEEDTSDDYKRMLPLGFKAFDATVFGLEKEYAFRGDNVIMDLSTNTIINVSRRNGEFVFLIERKTIPLSTIRTFVHGIGCEQEVEEPTIVEEESITTTTPTYKYIDWIEGIPKTKYRISSRGVFNTISEEWVCPYLNMSGNEAYRLTSTAGKCGERTSKQNKAKHITKKKLYAQAGMTPE